MFQIKRVDMITKTFRLPEDMLKELEILAQKNNISVNKLVIQCCRYALDHREPEDDSDLNSLSKNGCSKKTTSLKEET